MLASFVIGDNIEKIVELSYSNTPLNGKRNICRRAQPKNKVLFNHSQGLVGCRTGLIITPERRTVALANVGAKPASHKSNKILNSTE